MFDLSTGCLMSGTRCVKLGLHLNMQMADVQGQFQAVQAQNKVNSAKVYKNKVDDLPRPSQSTGLNIIGILWMDLKKAVCGRQPSNLLDLEQLCNEKWVQIIPERSKHCSQATQRGWRRLSRQRDDILSIRTWCKLFKLWLFKLCSFFPFGNLK